jgi:hypothetical protein
LVSAFRPASADPATHAVDAAPGFHLRRAQDRPQAELCEIARRADELGYRTIWVSEAWGRDAFVLLARLAWVASEGGGGCRVRRSGPAGRNR